MSDKAVEIGIKDDAEDESFSFDGIEVTLVNESGIPDDEVIKALKQEHRELAKVGSWVKGWNGSANRRSRSSILNQDRYSLPENIYDQMRVASDAAQYDDIVSNAVEVTEQLAFKRVEIDCGDEDGSNIGAQILKDIDFMAKVREIWRELFTVSQCYVAIRWGRKSYRVKAKTDDGRKRRRVYNNILVPTGISILDPLKIFPVGDFLFGEERLAYIADPYEHLDLQARLAGSNSTDIDLFRFFDGKYTPTEAEARAIGELLDDSGSADRLYLLNQDNVFRITATRPAYKRFADVRMASVFELLDLKHNLRESDRSDILGNLNCIVLVKKGSDQLPAQGSELAQVAAQMSTHSRNSVLVTDHRVDVEILTKKTDKTLQPERYNTLDSRITSRLFQILSTGNYASGTALDDSTKLFKVISASMQARRDHIQSILSKRIIERIWEENDKLDGEDPTVVFHPRRISLEFDNLYTKLMFDLAASGIISKNTLLDELDLDVEQEISRIRIEKDEYSDVWGEVQLGAGPAGRITGGNNNGGGANQQSYQTTRPNEPEGRDSGIDKPADKKADNTK